MQYLSGIYTDIGIKKKMNQDAAMVRVAETKKGNIVFAVVCDGMGGLEKGELASATVIHSMINWFENDFPNLLYENYTASMIKNSWMQTILKVNESICNYGEEHHIQLGTTLTALLLVEDVYYICNVGDSRIYYLDSGIRQITRDQSYVQQEIDMERMTEEEALKSDKRNILLQCIGVSNQVAPDFYFGEYQTSSAFLLCTDGFRHVINNQEMWDTLRPDLIENELDIERKILKLIELVKERQEEDNITAGLICAL